MDFKSRVEVCYLILADYKKYLGKLWVHYTDHDELKFNYKPVHHDPVGIYFFPESFRTGGQWHVKPYKFTAKLKPEAKVLDVSKITTVEDVKNILKELDCVPDNPEYYKELEEYSDRKMSSGKWFWQHIREKFQGRKGAYTKVFLDAGYDAIFDDSDSIFPGEDQLIVLKPKMLSDVKRIDMGATGYKEISKVRETILEALKSYDGKVIEAKKPKKTKGWGNDPAFIQSKIFFEQEKGGRNVVFTSRTLSSTMGGKRRPATTINLSVEGSSDVFKEHLGNYYNNHSHRPDSLQWRLEEFDPAKIKSWLEKSIKILWDDEEVLHEKKQREEFRKELERRRQKGEDLKAWAKETLLLRQEKGTPQSYETLINSILHSMEYDDIQKASDSIKKLQSYIDGVSDELKEQIKSEQASLYKKLDEIQKEGQ